MNTVLWIVTIVLALAFAAAGAGKLAQPKEKLLARMPWVADFSAGQVKGIGALELLGAIGLIVPGLLGIAPVLVPIAAVGLALLMLGAVITHVRRRDGFGAMLPSLVLLLLSAFVAWGRFGPYPL